MPLSFTYRDQQLDTVHCSEKRLREIREDKENPIALSCGHAGVIVLPKAAVNYVRHVADANCRICKPETKYHLLAKSLIAEAIVNAGWEAVIEASGPDKKWRADVLAIRGDEKVAFEVQWSQQSASEYEFRQKRYAKDGVRCVWMARHGEPAGVDQDIPILKLEVDLHGQSVTCEGAKAPDVVKALLDGTIQKSTHEIPVVCVASWYDQEFAIHCPDGEIRALLSRSLGSDILNNDGEQKGRPLIHLLVAKETGSVPATLVPMGLPVSNGSSWYWVGSATGLPRQYKLSEKQCGELMLVARRCTRCESSFTVWYVGSPKSMPVVTKERTSTAESAVQGWLDTHYESKFAAEVVEHHGGSRTSWWAFACPHCGLVSPDGPETYAFGRILYEDPHGDTRLVADQAVCQELSSAMSLPEMRASIIRKPRSPHLDFLDTDQEQETHQKSFYELGQLPLDTRVEDARRQVACDPSGDLGVPIPSIARVRSVNLRPTIYRSGNFKLIDGRAVWRVHIEVQNKRGITVVTPVCSFAPPAVLEGELAALQGQPEMHSLPSLRGSQVVPVFGSITRASSQDLSHK